MDHYKLLGVQKNASKEEIKQAFRKLAMEFHPDKHSQSSENLRNSATQKFKQLTEAYDTLIDDAKRADYNLKRSPYDHRYGGGAHSYGCSGGAVRSGGDGILSKIDMGFMFLNRRRFLLNATFIGLLLGGMLIVDSSGTALWEMRNDGKSFEEAMESIEKAKADKDTSY